MDRKREKDPIPIEEFKRLIKNLNQTLVASRGTIPTTMKSSLSDFFKLLLILEEKKEKYT